MYKVKWLETAVVVIAISLCLFFIFGRPHNPKNVTADQMYEAVQENNASKTFRILRAPILIGSSILVILGCILYTFEGRLFYYMYLKGKRALAFGLVHLTIGVYSVFMFVVFSHLLLSLLVLNSTSSEILKEYARSDYIFTIGTMVMGFLCLCSQIEWLRYLKKWEIGENSENS